MPGRGYLQVHPSGRPRSVRGGLRALSGRPSAGGPGVLAAAGRAAGRRGVGSCAADSDRFVLLHDPAEGVSRFGEFELDGRAAVAVYRDDVLQSLTLAAGRRAACGEAVIQREQAENGYAATAPTKSNRE